MTLLEHQFFVEKNHLLLRPLLIDDIESMRLLRNRNRNYFLFSEQITVEEQNTWYKSYQNKEKDYMFSIFYKQFWIGAVAIYDVKDGHGEFGRLMIDSSREGCKGLGVRVTKMISEIAFLEMNLHVLDLEVYCDNVAAQITYLKAGFLPVGIFSTVDGTKMLQMQLYPNNTNT